MKSLTIGDLVSIPAGYKINDVDALHFGLITSNHHLNSEMVYISGIGDAVEKERLTLVLGDLVDLAIRAHSGTSFDPEKRGKNIIISSNSELSEDLNNISDDGNKMRYVEGYKKHLSAWLHAKSSCISSMITGPARFPVARAEKANRSEHNRLTEFSEYRSNFFDRLKKSELAARTPEQVNADSFKTLRNQITSSAETIIGLDNGTVRGYSRALFVSSISGKIETVAKSGNIKLLEMCLNLIKELNSSPLAVKPVISDKHKIWKFLEVAEVARERQEDLKNTDNEVLKFDQGEIVLNYELNRIQIVYDGKPDRDTINTLKKHAFRWSPSNSAWQRHLNNAGKYAVQSVTGYKFTS